MPRTYPDRSDPSMPSEPVHVSTCINELVRHLEAMSQADGCPTPGCDNVEPAIEWFDHGDTYTTSHRCTLDGAEWVQSWGWA